jgi:NAD(P)H-quinone oxidoreductase subunit 5
MQKTCTKQDQTAAAGEIFSLLCVAGALAAIPFLDRLTDVLLVLSTFLFAVICRYSGRYLAGDPGQARFYLWLCCTGSCVFALILAQNLLLFAFAWLATSLSLHQLLRFYPDRPGALLAARKKFLISRLGDCALAGALILTYRVFGTWDFRKLFAAAQSLRAGEQVPAPVNVIVCLLVFAAMLKSAQFPFHSWLPDTMETPTPVSALMHAGIINAGGILVIRLSPIVSLSPVALMALTVVGAFTALFGSVVALTQASVKRCLAFSTVAQMGFMMLECGLGAFHLALLHLAAHSLYKAYAFLSSGSVVSTEPPRADTATGVAALVAGSLPALLAWLTNFAQFDQPVLSGIFFLALAQLLWRSKRGWQALTGVLAGACFTAVYFGLETAASTVVTPVHLSPDRMLSAAILTLFLLTALLQSQLPRICQTDAVSTFYIHARNGFYFNTLANRLTIGLWPVQHTERSL